MASFARRSNIEILRSQDTPFFTEPTFKALTEAEADAAELIAQKYRKFDVSDNIVEMDAAEKASKDAALAAQAEADSASDAVATFDTPASQGEPLGLEQRSEVRERNQDYNDLIQRIHFLERVVAELLASSGNNWNAARSAAQTEADAMTQDPRNWPAISAGGLAQNTNADRWFPARLDRTQQPSVLLNPSIARTPADGKTLLRQRINSLSEKDP